MDPLQLSDEQHLLLAAARGEPDAVRWLLDDVAPVVHGFLWARVGDRAVVEDLLQEALLQAMRSASAFRGDAKASTWLCGIARHLVTRHWEKERRTEVAAARLALVPEPSEDDLLQRAQVVQALQRRPALHRQVLVLKYLDGLAVEEIATEVGRSRVQVQSLLQRAREGLRRELT